MKNLFKRYCFAFVVLVLTVGVIWIVYSCSSSRLSVSEDAKQKYEAVSQKGIEVQKKLKQNKEKLQVHYSVKEKMSVQADTLFGELFEGMDTMFDTWNEMMDKKHDRLIELEELSNNNFSIWLAVIAAICTVLPVVLALHQNHTFEERIKKAEKDISETVETLEKQINEKKDEITNLSNRIRVTELLDISSRNLIVMNNLTELEVRENVLITCDDEVRKGIEMVFENIKQSNEHLKILAPKLDADEKAIIIHSYLCMMCIFREMLYRYESEFTGENLIKLQQNRYLVSLLIHELLDADEKKIEDLKTLGDNIFSYVNIIKNVFKSEIRKLAPKE